MSTFEEAVAAAKAGDLAGVASRVAAEPELLAQRDDETHALLDHAIWALLVGDYSRPPAIAPDPGGTRMAIVRHLLDAGADVNGAGQEGWTPLHSALYANHVELTRELLARGADPSAEVHGDGGTPLLQALFWGHAEAADALAEQTIDPLNLRVAAGLGRADLIERCFDASGALTPAAGARRGYYRPHADFPEWASTGDRQEILDEAFVYAARNGRAHVMGGLLARGADVSGAPYGGSALHWTAGQGRRDLCAWLIARGADVNLATQYGAQRGVTPLHCAAWMDRVDVARLLVEHGADTTIRDATHDGTPRDWAEHMKAPAVARYLADRS